VLKGLTHSYVNERPISSMKKSVIGTDVMHFFSLASGTGRGFSPQHRSSASAAMADPNCSLLGRNNELQTKQALQAKHAHDFTAELASMFQKKKLLEQQRAAEAERERRLAELELRRRRVERGTDAASLVKLAQPIVRDLLTTRGKVSRKRALRAFLAVTGMDESEYLEDCELCQSFPRVVSFVASQLKTELGAKPLLLVKGEEARELYPKSAGADSSGSDSGSDSSRGSRKKGKSAKSKKKSKRRKH
jgi:hypothetical protein